jgi:hypothetical protein
MHCCVFDHITLSISYTHNGDDTLQFQLKHATLENNNKTFVLDGII